MIHSHWTAIVMLAIDIFYLMIEGKKRSVPLTKYPGTGSFKISWGTVVENCCYRLLNNEDWDSKALYGLGTLMINSPWELAQLDKRGSDAGCTCYAWPSQKLTCWMQLPGIPTLFVWLPSPGMHASSGQQGPERRLGQALKTDDKTNNRTEEWPSVGENNQ